MTKIIEMKKLDEIYENKNELHWNKLRVVSKNCRIINSMIKM